MKMLGLGRRAVPGRGMDVPNAEGRVHRLGASTGAPFARFRIPGRRDAAQVRDRRRDRAGAAEAPSSDRRHRRPSGRGGATTKVAIVRDPNNLFLVLIRRRRGAR